MFSSSEAKPLIQTSSLGRLSTVQRLYVNRGKSITPLAYGWIVVSRRRIVAKPCASKVSITLQVVLAIDAQGLRRSRRTRHRIGEFDELASERQAAARSPADPAPRSGGPGRRSRLR